MPDRIITKPIAQQWQDHRNKWSDCQRCTLCGSRNRVVLFRGRIPCDILYIETAPGETEDAMGSPLYGDVQPVHDAIHQTAVNMIGDRPLKFAVTSILACRTPDRRDPTPTEMEACRPRLQSFIQLARPKLLVYMGSISDAIATKSSPHEMPWVSTVHPFSIRILENDYQSMRAEILFKQSVRTIVKGYTQS